MIGFKAGRVHDDFEFVPTEELAQHKLWCDERPIYRSI